MLLLYTKANHSVWDRHIPASALASHKQGEIFIWLIKAELTLHF
jgi:hypothetical protein